MQQEVIRPLLTEKQRLWTYKPNVIRGLPGLHGERIDIPVYEHISPVPGLLLTISAGMHPGPESTAIVAAIWAGLALTKYSLLRGRILLIPQSNIWAVLAGTHNIPQSDSDWNRCFPGVKEGSIAERAAYSYFMGVKNRFLENARLLNHSGIPGIWIDFHTEDISEPYLRRDWKLLSQRNGESIQVVEMNEDELADASGITVVNEYPPEIYLERELHHSITGAATNDPEFLGRAYTIELGESGRVSADNAAVGVKIILRLAAKLGMIDLQNEEIIKPESSRIALSKDNLSLVPINTLFVNSGDGQQQITIDSPGYPSFLVYPNQFVQREQDLGYLTIPSVLTIRTRWRVGSPITFVAPCDGWIISLPKQGQYFIGNDLITMAVTPDKLKKPDALNIGNAS